MTLPLILGIDPGPVTSGVVLYDPVQGKVVEAWAKMPTYAVLVSARLRSMAGVHLDVWDLVNAHLAMEHIVSYGAKIGGETIDTIEPIGRIKEAWSWIDENATYKSRPDILEHITGNRKATPAECNYQLSKRFGGKDVAVGTKKQPGPLYGVTSHAWSALAVAVVASDLLRKKETP